MLQITWNFTQSIDIIKVWQYHGDKWSKTDLVFSVDHLNVSYVTSQFVTLRTIEI